MKFISFNINGIRAHIHQIFKIIDKHKPDIIGLQETKVEDLFFPLEQFKDTGYNIYYCGQKSYNGVAIFSKKKLISVKKNFKHSFFKNIKYRIILGSFFARIGKITLINAYFPQGNNRNDFLKFSEKKFFYENLIFYIKKNFSKDSNIIIMGDMNISQSEYDIGIGQRNKERWLNLGKCSFLPEEQIWISNLKSLGFIDTFRKKNPIVSNQFSWFDYRSKSFLQNKGLRIDLILSSNSLFSYCVDVGIDYEIRRMSKVSDHAPIWATFNLN